MSTVNLYQGDASILIKGFPNDFFDSIVTDPPHEIGFMGKQWDSTGVAYSVPLWTEMLRVLKPGRCLIAKGNGRTYHRMACAIEDAGFVVEDLLVRLNGNNNPKTKGRLKNANEPLILARKPGPILALNIDACRIPVSDASYRTKCESVVGLDSNRNGACYGEWGGVRTNSFNEVASVLGDTSRFFYCPRASSVERMGRKHPTITPDSLAAWLVRLVTPVGGCTLDPFMGSGSFMAAAARYGIDAYGFELDPDNYAEAVKYLQTVNLVG